MARRRFFVDRVCNGTAEISGDNAHHLTRVLRVEAGQKYEITDSRQVWVASVKMARRNLVEFVTEEEIQPLPEPAPVTLLMSLIKFDRFEWAVEKATELGIARIVPVEASRSDRGLLDGAQKRVERWRRIARDASEQSRRLRAPRIDDPIRLAVALGSSFAHRLWLDEHRDAPPLLRAFQLRHDEAVAVAVGPEGGWTAPERSAFLSSGWTGASLGHSILRSETAACAALSVISQMA